MALVMLPVPLIGLWRSLSDVLQVAPDELDAQVHAVMKSIVSERAFVDYSSYVAKVGRARFVEIHVLVKLIRASIRRLPIRSGETSQSG